MASGKPVKATRADLAAALKNPHSAVKDKRKKESSKLTMAERAELDAKGGGLSGASKAWREKYIEMSATETWLCFCFRNDKDLHTFAERWGIGPAEQGQMLNGYDVAEKLNISLDHDNLPPRNMMQMKFSKDQMRAAMNYKPHPNPLADYVEPDDLEEDFAKEFEILLHAIEHPDTEWFERTGHLRVDNHPHWFIVLFGGTKTHAAFLRRSGLDGIGNKYLDAYQAAKVLGFEL